MAIAVRATSTATAGINSLTLTIPATVQAGDALFIVAGAADADANWPTPTGWSLIERRSRDTSTTGASAAVFKKVATAGDAGATVTLTATTTAHSSGMLAAYSGTDIVNPVHAWTGFTETAASGINTHTLPSVTTTVDQCQILTTIVGKDGSTTVWTMPAGYTKQVDVYLLQSGRITGALADAGPKPIGTYSPGNATQDGVSKYAFAWTVAVVPRSSVQTARPIADVDVANAIGVPTPGEGSGIYADVAATDDAHYVEIASAGHYECRFAALLDPADDTGHTISYRLRYGGGATSGSCTTEIRQGSTVIATLTDTATDAFTDVSHTLTTAQAAAITDYADLRVRFIATAA